MTSTGSVGGDARLRLFLALPIPEQALRAIGAWADARLPGAERRLPPEQQHVTLAFLGARPARELRSIADGLRAAAQAARSPVLVPERYRETRSVGMLVLRDEGGQATRLAADVHERLERLGVYTREQRPWLPHVTLLRFKQGRGRSRPGLSPPPPELPPFSPSEAAVYLSRLHPSGARYEVLDSVHLGRRTA